MRNASLRVLVVTLLLLSTLVLPGHGEIAEAAVEDAVAWTDAEPGQNREPTITIDASVYPRTGKNNSYETGVQFWINGQLDDRHPKRPGGWDATGPQEGSTFHIYPAIDLSDGDVLEARWVDTKGVSHQTSLSIGGSVQFAAPSSTSADTTWFDVSPGSDREPTVSIADGMYPQTGPNNTHKTGVQFWINGQLDDRHPKRPGGWDATGPQEGSTFHIYPAVELQAGDVLEARWVDASGTTHTSTHAVAAGGGSFSPEVDTPDEIDDEEVEPETLLERENPVTWRNGTEVNEPDAIWSGVAAGEAIKPHISIAGFIYPKTAVNEGFERGVQFLVNGEPFDEHINRPDGWDSTGPLEGSLFVLKPLATLVAGDVLEARWVAVTGRSYFSRAVVPGTETDAPADTDSVVNASDEVAWSDITQGSGREPTITINDDFYPESGPNNQYETGVQFWVNSEIDERHHGRPGGWDATGPRENSTFHMYPGIELEPGDVIEARWTGTNGTSYVATLTIDDTAGEPEPQPVTSSPSSPTPTPTPAPSPEPAPASSPPPSASQADVDGLGPTGQWPSSHGFPAYDTAATVTTDGTLSGLRDAMAELDSKGGVIEHPGHIRDVGWGGLTRSGSAPMVIRPPLGQRAEFDIDGGVYLRGDGILLAGYYHRAGSIYPYDVVNSGAAWIESDFAGEFRVTAYRDTSRTITGLLYEAVYRNYRTGIGSDRATVNAVAPGARTRAEIVGVWMAGHARTPGSAAHVDTIQIVETQGGSAGATIRNSVIWPSSNVAMQGTGVTGFTIINSWFAEPQYARDMFPAGDPGPGLDGYGSVTGKADISGSVMLGNTHPRSTVNIWNTQLFAPGTTYIDRGGNTDLNSIWDAVPPLAPSHEELDDIWHD